MRQLKGGADVFVGMQYGSEGKGAVVAALSSLYDGAVRTGAPNAGHTVIYKGKPYKMRSIPCAWVNPKCRLFIGAGGLINPDVLALESVDLPPDVVSRLRIDRNASLVTHADIKEEEGENLNAHNGSTCEGVGVAQARKIRRNPAAPARLAGDWLEMGAYITDVSAELNDMIDEGLSVMLEGTQGTHLSLNHGRYPYVTSRDILASSLLSDAGLAPSTCRNVFGVARTYPIRVAGNSGPIGESQDITWQEVSKRCGAPEGTIVERTTVTNRVRRVSELDLNDLRMSIKLNRPDGIFFTFVDYIDWNAHGIKDWDALPSHVRYWVRDMIHMLSVPILGVGTGPDSLVMTPWANDFEILRPLLKAEIA